MHDELMINGNELNAKLGKNDNTVRVPLRLPWYRSLPLGCIEQIDVSINGKKILREKTHLLYNCISYSLDEILQLDPNATWFPLDVQEVELTLDEPMKDGEYEVSVLIELRIPYYKFSMDPTVANFTQYAVCNKKMQMIRGLV